MFNNKSKLKIISMALSALISIELIVRPASSIVRLTLWASGVYNPETVSSSATFLWFPQIFVTTFLPIVYFLFLIGIALVAFQFIAAFLSFKTTKKSWTIVHIIMLVVISFVGEILRGPNQLIFLNLWLWIITVILSIIGYFDQKRLNSI